MDDPEVTEGDERIRALLAESGSARRSERMPEEVAARLDQTLADLVAEREAAGSVVPLRRRWAPRLAVAAAAVIVLGGGGVVASSLGAFDQTGQADSATSGSAAAERDTSALAETPSLASGAFGREVAALLEESPAPLRPDARQEAGDSAASACAGPGGRAGADRRAVRLDGEPAVLLVHPRRGDRRLVEAWTCDGARRLAATTVSR